MPTTITLTGCEWLRYSHKLSLSLRDGATHFGCHSGTLSEGVIFSRFEMQSS